MTTYRPVLLAAALLALLLAACAAGPASGGRDDKSAGTADNAGAAASGGGATSPAGPALRGYRWHLDRATDAAGKPIALLQREGKYGLRLAFGDDALNVSGGCNHVGAGYDIKGDHLDIGEFNTTLMACEDSRLMQMDSAIAEQLKGRVGFSIEGDAPNLSLRLTTAGGAKFVLSGEATPETRYGGPGAVQFFEVDPQLRSCPHPLIAHHQCLWVRERRYDANGIALKPDGEWHFLYDGIEGYEHQAGVRNVLRVKKFDVKNPPADGSTIAYVLDMVVESENVAAATAK